MISPGAGKSATPIGIPSATGAAQPLVWVVLGDKPGDNAQVRAIAQVLPWACIHKHIQVLDPFILGKPKVGPTLYHIDRERSDPLEPPWPDFILTSGRRPTNVALWIRKQSAGRTRIVLLGKPSSRPDDYDLIIYSAENQFPALPNLQPISLPLMRVEEAEIGNASRVLEPSLRDLPRPLIAFLVGGPTGPFVFNPTTTRHLLECIHRVIDETGGTPYVTTSRRTPPEVAAALQAGLPAGARLFAWSANAPENPYRGLLGLADGFVVTGDSISMMVEVVRLGKPLGIFPLAVGPLGAFDQMRRAFTRWLFQPGSGTPAGGVRQALAGMLYRSHIVTQTRDFVAFHEMLVNKGLAAYAGDALPRPPSGRIPDDLGIAVQRIMALMAAA